MNQIKIAISEDGKSPDLVNDRLLQTVRPPSTYNNGHDKFIYLFISQNKGLF